MKLGQPVCSRVVFHHLFWRSTYMASRNKDILPAGSRSYHTVISVKALKAVKATSLVSSFIHSPLHVYHNTSLQPGSVN